MIGGVRRCVCWLGVHNGVRGVCGLCAMSVATHLDLDRTTPPPTAVQAWPGWVAGDARLVAVPDPVELRSWLQTQPAEEVNGVLLALADLSRATGPVDDRRAALLLAWALLPGACQVARRLALTADAVDELVAAQLWMEVRTVSASMQWIAAGVMRRVHDQVLAVGRGFSRSDRGAWARTFVDGGAAADAQADQCREVGDPADELSSLLEWACSASVIGDADRMLLLGVVTAAASQRLRDSGAGGLLGEPAETLAAQLGVSSRTVRRRVSKVIAALSSATDAYLAA